MTISLGGILAVLIVGVAFGLGVLVGADQGGDDRGGEPGSSEYRGEYQDRPDAHDGREQDDARDGDDRQPAGDRADTDRNSHANQPTAPEAPGGRTIEPPTVPGPPR